MLKLYTNVVTGKTYDENGDLFEDGLPVIFYKTTATVRWQLCSETPDIAEGSDDTPETAWTKCTDYSQYAAVGAFLTADDDYIKRRQGTLSAAVSAGAVSTIEATVNEADFDTVPSTGVIELFDSEGESEVIKYKARSIEDGVVTFTLVDGSTVERSYESGSPMDCSDEPLMQAALDGQNSDVANGLFCFKIRAFSRKLHDLVAYSNTKTIDVMGLELAIFRIDSDTNAVVDLERFEVDTFQIRTGMAETSANPPLTDDEANETVTLCNTLLAAGFSLQFSNDNTNWHDTQVTTGETIDTYFRFRSAGSGGTWSNGIRLVKGDKGDDGASAFIYIRYASDNQGTGFSVTPSDSLPYIGVLATTEEIETPSASDFTGLWVLFKGPKGDPGTPGTNGTRGTKTYFGTAVTGTSTTAAVFDTDIEDALAGDCYVNTSTLNLYECTLGGADTVAKWKYVNTLKGTPGASKYQYIAYASNSSGSGFSMTPSDSLGYIAFKNSDTEITNPSASDFTGLWTKFHGNDGTSSYTYVAYASSSSGSNFSLTPSDSLKYRAEIHTTTPISSPSSSDFSGATWVKYLGDNGTNGTNGTRGSRINYGTSITGTSTTPTAYATGISDSLVNDQYINTDTLNLYRCTTAGNASTAKWVYVDSMKGTPAEAALEGVKLNGQTLTPTDKVVDVNALPAAYSMPSAKDSKQNHVLYLGTTTSGDSYVGNLITYDHTERPEGMTLQIADNTKTGTQRVWSADDPMDNTFYVKYSNGNWVIERAYYGQEPPYTQIGTLTTPSISGQPWGLYTVNSTETWAIMPTTAVSPASKYHLYEKNESWHDNILLANDGSHDYVLHRVGATDEWTSSGSSGNTPGISYSLNNGCWIFTADSISYTSPACASTVMPWELSGQLWINDEDNLEITPTIERQFTGGWTDAGSIVAAS